VPAIYFSLKSIQPFADMRSDDMEGEEGVKLLYADGDLCGLRLAEPRMVSRLDGIIEKLGINPDLVWNRLRADTDYLTGRRTTTWGQRGNM
jgi:hypothetical protein